MSDEDEIPCFACKEEGDPDFVSDNSSVMLAHYRLEHDFEG